MLTPMASDYTFEPDLSRAATLPARWYRDPAVLDAERRRVFPRSCQAVGHACEVAKPGSWLGCQAAGEPVLVTRAADGKLRAMSNVCRHRGSELCQGSGSGNTIRCPYHGWTYTLEGALHGTPEFEGVQDWDRTQVRLPEFRADIWGPYLFVCQEASAPPLAEVMGNIPAEVAGIGCRAEELI